MKSKILIVTSGFPLWENEGLNAFMLDLAKAVAKNYELVVLAPYSKKSKSEEVIQNFKVYRHAQFPFFDFEIAYGSGIPGNIKKNPLLAFVVPFFLIYQLLAIIKIVKKHKIDVINAHWIIPQGVTTAFYKKIFNNKIKIISTIHGSDYLTLNNFIGNFFKKFVLKNSDAISVVSLAIKNKLSVNGYNSNVHYFPLGVNTSYFTPGRGKEEFKKKHNINGPVMLFVGGIIETKGVRYLIQAMPAIVKMFPEVRLFMVGDGNLKQEMIELAEKLKIRENIVFSGIVPNQDLPPYYGSSDIFVLPSFSEGYPVVIKESLSSGNFAVVTDLPVYNAYPEFQEILFKIRVKNHKDISERVIHILKNQHDLQNIKAKSREFIVKTTDWSVFSENYKKMLESNLI